jgi:hypothetical protein
LEHEIKSNLLCMLFIIDYPQTNQFHLLREANKLILCSFCVSDRLRPFAEPEVTVGVKVH